MGIVEMKLGNSDIGAQFDGDEVDDPPITPLLLSTGFGCSQQEPQGVHMFF